MKKIEKATRDEQILGRVLGEDEWKSVLLTNVYNHFYIKSFGKATTARRKTEQLINETINEFCRVWGFSRKYEVRHSNGKDFLDFLKSRIVERTVFTYYVMDNMNVRALNLTSVELIDVTCSMVAAPLAKKRNDNSLGYNATLRRIYGEMSARYGIVWSNRMKRANATSKHEVIENNPKLRKLFNNVVNDILERGDF
mgnify:FL=1